MTTDHAYSTDNPCVATPGICANRRYAEIGGRCCAHCGQQIHWRGHRLGWRHISTGLAACEAVEAARPVAQ